MSEVKAFIDVCQMKFKKALFVAENSNRMAKIHNEIISIYPEKTGSWLVFIRIHAEDAIAKLLEEDNLPIAMKHRVNINRTSTITHSAILNANDNENVQIVGKE